MDAQVRYIQRCVTRHTVGPLHAWIPNRRSKTLFSIHGWLTPWMQNQKIQKGDCIFIENNLHVSGPMQFKPLMFKGQLYYLSHLKCVCVYMCVCAHILFGVCVLYTIFTIMNSTNDITPQFCFILNIYGHPYRAIYEHLNDKIIFCSEPII